MTKEELEKEVEKYLEEKHCKNVCIYDEIEECKKGIRIRCFSFNYRKGLIVDFAEPREKRIAELEKRCARYEMELSKMEKGTCDVCKETEKDKRLEELEQENKSLINIKNIYIGDLLKAKELLKKWVELYKPKVGNIPPTPIQVETEQFLSEVEK